MKTLKTVISVCLLSAYALLNGQAPAQNNARAPQGPPANIQMSEAGRSVEHKMTSKFLGKHVTYSVYLPQSYDREPSRKYPILYLLHGAGDDNLCWENKAFLSRTANAIMGASEATEMIIVTPRASATKEEGAYEGYFNFKDFPWQYESFFFEEFMPLVEKEYRVLADKEHRSVGGLSMGGGGCVAYCQKHPELFSSCYAMSALLALPPAGGPMNESLARMMGDYDCIGVVEKADEATVSKLNTVKWYLDCGDDDFLFDGNISFYKAMINKKINCELRVRNGGHTWEYWHTALYSLLPFVSVNFGK
jgi:S-formylglutathione hydrolase FrmB